LIHWACYYEREKIVSLLVSKNATLSLKFEFIGKYNGKTPFEIATINNSQKIRAILIETWPKIHKMLPMPTKSSIEELLCCISQNYNIPKELHIKIIHTMLMKRD